MSDSLKFLPKEVSPHAVVADLNHLLPDIEEIFVMVKMKDGEWAPSCSGELAGLAFAIMYLQQYWHSCHE